MNRIEEQQTKVATRLPFCLIISSNVSLQLLGSFDVAAGRRNSHSILSFTAPIANDQERERESHLFMFFFLLLLRLDGRLFLVFAILLICVHTGQAPNEMCYTLLHMASHSLRI